MQRTVHSLGLLMKSCASVVMIASSRRRSARTADTAVLDAAGFPWEFAPKARDCCGSGGVYNIQKPDNARAILREKSAFFDELPAEVSPILATANHVCMMQWHTARRFVQRPFQVRHVIQLLDPEADLAD